MNVFAVVFGNYSPYEIDSLWEIETDANRRADELKSQWHVIPLTVNAAQHEDRPATLPESRDESK